MTRMTSQLDRGVEDLLWASHALPSALLAMRDAMQGQPGAQSYDAIRSGLSTVLYCELHERDLTDCEGCDGVPVPVHQDPTGDAGIAFDEARQAQRQAQRLCAEAEQVGDKLVALIRQWQRRAATESERSKAEGDNKPACELHLRVGQWVPAHVLSSTVAGALDHEIRACRDCYERIRSTGAEPSRADLEHHKTTGKWPRARAA